MTVDRDQFDEGVEAALGAIVCSQCGWNHDRDESAACDGCEAIRWDEYVSRIEARLARVHTLVEALREMLDRMETCDEPGCEAEQHVTYEIKDALAAWDADQPDPDPTP